MSQLKNRNYINKQIENFRTEKNARYLRKYEQAQQQKADD